MAFDLVLYHCSDRATVTDVFPNDLLRLEVAGIPVDLLTGIHSEETHLPQPLLISITADLEPTPEYRPQTPLGFSKDYLDLRNAALQAIPRDLHFTLIESIADHIANKLLAEDVRVRPRSEDSREGNKRVRRVKSRGVSDKKKK